MAPSRGAPDRVRLAQRQARWALATAVPFLLAAAAVAAAGGPRWLALHLFLTGGVVTTISGATVLFTVTWSAAPAPPPLLLGAQRACIAVGAAGITAARQWGAPAVLFAAPALVYLAGLAGLAAILVATVHRGVQRRFDVAVAWYVAALAAGVAAAGIGAALGTGHAPYTLRHAHVTLNLLGLVGLVIAGTLPTFTATVGRTRPSPRATPRRLAALLAVQVAALALATAGYAAQSGALAGAGLGLYAGGLAALAAALPRPGRRPLVWAGPRLIGLWAGLAWWAVAVVATAADVARGRAPFAGRWLLVLVLAGIGQVLWGSLAYLVPVLRAGGPDVLSWGFGAMRSWLGLGAANLVGVALAVGPDGAAGLVATAAGAVWLVDTAARAVVAHRRAGPPSSPSLSAAPGP